jgi:hypothetical protein
MPEIWTASPSPRTKRNRTNARTLRTNEARLCGSGSHRFLQNSECAMLLGVTPPHQEHNFPAQVPSVRYTDYALVHPFRAATRDATSFIARIVPLVKREMWTPSFIFRRIQPSKYIARTSSAVGPLVSALDKDRAPSYWFPRDCSRACCCP